MWKNTSSRTTPLPPNWRQLRATILNRDGHQCTAIRGDTGQRCEAKATDVDHIGDPSDHRPHMLRSLCAYHHRRVTGAQGGTAIRAKTNHPAPKHPGLRRPSQGGSK